MHAPPVASHALTVTLSVPGGSFSVTVHVKFPAWLPSTGQVALGSVPVSKNRHASKLYAPSVPVVAVPLTVELLLMTNLTDFVADDTYEGRRLNALLCGPGIVILNVASASGPV